MNSLHHFTTFDNRFAEFTAHLHRRGTWAAHWAKFHNGQMLTEWHAAGRLPALDSEWRAAELYYTVNPAVATVRRSRTTRTKIEDVAAINCIFADFDGGHFPYGKTGALRQVMAAAFPPSAIIDSGGGYHCYWLIDQPVMVDRQSRELLAGIQAAWVRFVGADKAVVDLARVLRVPGSFNHKYSPARPVTFIHFDMATQYTFPTLANAVANLLWEKVAAPAKPVVVERSFSYTGGGDGIDELRRAAMVRSGQAREWDRYMAGDISGKPSHSEADLALCKLAVWWYGHDAQVIEAIWQSSGLWRPAEAKEDHADYVQRTIRKALAKVRGEWRPSQRDQAAIRAVEGLVR